MKSGNQSRRPPRKPGGLTDLWVECGGSKVELYGHLEVTHWVANLLTHTSGRSLNDSLERGVVRHEGLSLYGYGQTAQVDESRMRHCLQAAAFRLGWLARLLLLKTDRPIDDLEKAYVELIHTVKALAPSQRAKVGRNDPCWCGSGVKLKKCHGATWV